MRRVLVAAVCSVLLLALPVRAHDRPDPKTVAEDARAFLELFESMFLGVFAVTGQAAWDASTDVTPEHEGARVAAGKAMAAIAGSPKVIEAARHFLEHKNALDPLTVRQLNRILLNAAESPGTIPDVVAARVEAESRQAATLDSFQFCMERSGETCTTPITANEIDNLLDSSRDLAERLRVWKASKQTGPALKPGLVELQRLRNQVAKEMGHDSFFHLQVADYGMTVDEMMAMLRGFMRDLQPLYEQMHCYAKNELARRYGQPVPKRIPAHWINNRWAQNWDGIVEGVSLDEKFTGKTPEWIVQQAEAFYVSMGFPKLPEGFWKRSDLYPVEKDSERKKNTHASAWHVNLQEDVRSLMSVEANERWFGTAHHELGHVYYYLSYTRPDVPPLLRGGANRGFHEGIGELISIAAMQIPYLRQVGILGPNDKLDETAWLLNEAFSQTVPFIPWSAGTMSHWERDLYAETLPPEQWNARWWDYVQRFQGVDPPEPRTDATLCDACTKTHVNDDPAQYYDYAVATVLKYQLHDHIARKILKADPHRANYFGRKDVGDFLRGILEKGETQDWRTLLRETTGEDLSTRAMVEYFRPVVDFLKKANAGKDCSWE